MIICQQAVVDVGGSVSSSGGGSGVGASRCTIAAGTFLAASSPSSATSVSPQLSAPHKILSSPSNENNISGMSNLSLALMKNNHVGASNTSPRSSMQMMEDQDDITCEEHEGHSKSNHQQVEEEDLITILPRSHSWTARAAFHEPPLTPGAEGGIKQDEVHLSGGGGSIMLAENDDGFILLDVLQKSPFADNDTEDERKGGADEDNISSWNTDDKLSNGILWDSNEKEQAVVVSRIHKMCTADKEKLRLRMFEVVEEEWVTNNSDASSKDAAAQDQLAEFRSFLVGASQ